jgi:hypothetical protein
MSRRTSLCPGERYRAGVVLALIGWSLELACV